MATNINTFKLFVEFVSNKVQIGNTVSPSQFNLLCDRAQMQVFERDYETFLATEEASNFLSFFLTNLTTSVPSTGYLFYPSDFQHLASVRAYFARPGGESTEIPTKEVKIANWGEISTSQLQEPTPRFPKYCEFSDGIRFLPKLIGTVMIDYYRTPVIPIWGYTVMSSRPVYDPATSTNFEWDSFALNEVAAAYLALIGVNLKDGELMQFAQMYKQETESKL